MKLAIKILYAVMLWLSVAQYASACVSAGYSHTCNKDCSSWSGVWYGLCIWGAVNPASVHK